MSNEYPRKMGHLVQQTWKADLGVYGGRNARRSFSYEAFVPDPIADFEPVLPGNVAQVVVEAEEAVRALNVGPDAVSLEAVARYLLRAESVASSRIEGLLITQRRLAEALFAPDNTRDVTALSVINNIHAMEAAVALGSTERPITEKDIRDIHRTLLNTPRDAGHAGTIRTTQNWIGGRATSPLGAEFVPPPPEEVPALLSDLCVFLDRSDLPTVVQAALAHAQFETIHPFADGNGRVGRCLVHVVFRRRGLANRYVPPVSVILATNATSYIMGLTDYRNGEVAEWCALFAAATRTAGLRAQDLMVRLSDLQEEWRRCAGNPRRGSAAAKLLPLLPAYPVINVATAMALTKTSDEAARLAIQVLEAAGILTQTTIGQRNRAWAAREVFALINAFEWELATPEDPAEERRPSPTRGRRAQNRRQGESDGPQLHASGPPK
jgi:Fic family protein